MDPIAQEATEHFKGRNIAAYQYNIIYSKYKEKNSWQKDEYYVYIENQNIESTNKFQQIHNKPNYNNIITHTGVDMFLFFLRYLSE
jgi:hypothetical protein